MNDYESIIKIEKYEPSHKHPRMSMDKRSSIFAPFSALTGYSDEVKETERITDRKIELDNDLQEILNKRIINLKKGQKVSIEYFVRDNRKAGGKYINKYGIIKNIDCIKKQIIFIDKTVILIDDIVNIK